MTITAPAPPTDASFHAVQRRLAALLPDAETLADGGTLELANIFAREKARLDPADVIEGTTYRALPVTGTPVPRFAAFLDGTQSSRVTQYVAGIPIVHATTAAVVRERREQRLATWRQPLVSRRLYAPMTVLTPAARAAIEECGAEVNDTTARRNVDSIHPFAFQELALEAVQHDRSALERTLAEAWYAKRTEVLFIDGGISDSPIVAKAAHVVGVVKTHQQLYVDGTQLSVVLGLQERERTVVCRVAPRNRTPVASWYLRLRGAKGRDPLWGLVRVEIADPKGASDQAIGQRADDVSRWVLAEALPLALPDGRWDKMVYGIRDCEEFLRAIQ